MARNLPSFKLIGFSLAIFFIVLFNGEFANAASSVDKEQKEVEAPLLGKNVIRSVKIEKDDDDYIAVIRYFYTGEPSLMRVAVYAGYPNDESTKLHPVLASESAVKGENTVKLAIPRPPYLAERFFTSKIISFFSPDKEDDIKFVQDYKIEWADASSYFRERELKKTPIDVLYKKAVEFIDQGDSNALQTAKSYLEKIVIEKPTYVDVYPEFARIAMKENWSQEGLSRAEQYLNTGLSIDKNHANSHILLGYVYTFQNKPKDAEAEFKKAEKIGTNNLWLWTNWGGLWLQQKNLDKAIQMYIKAISVPRSYNSYDRARLDAYGNLFNIYESKKAFDKADILYSQRENEYPTYPCFYSEHAEFQIYEIGAFDKALETAKKSIEKGCNTDYSRNTLGIANYLGWYKSKKEQKLPYITLARTFFPEGAELYFTLAKSDSTNEVLNALVKDSKKIDVKNNDNLTALALALASNDTTSARRLISIGANPNETVGKENYPVALIPIFTQSKEGIDLLVKSGVDFNKLKFNGLTALDYSKKQQNREIQEILENLAKAKT